MYAPAVKPADLAAVLAAWQLDAATGALTAALTDPDDPDWLARTLFVLHYGTERFAPVGDAPDLRDEAAREWDNRLGFDHRRAHWRAVADGLRATITGEGA